MRKLISDFVKLFFFLGFVAGGVAVGLLLYKKKSIPETTFRKAIKQKTFPKVKVLPSSESDKMNSRQQEIFSIIIRKKEVDMQEILSQVKGVTERTLRRDLLKLSELKLVRKSGSTKQAKYILV
jgi:predicted HTH transcriptional regulator